MPEVADHLAHIMEMECDECKPSKGTNTLYDMFSEDGEYNSLGKDINSLNKFAYFVSCHKEILDGNIPIMEDQCEFFVLVISIKEGCLHILCLL